MTDPTITQRTTQRTEVMLVTPALATSWLEQNVKFRSLDPKANRAVRSVWVDTLANRLRAGQWLLMPHGVVFAASGRLLDGQHRLMAIVKANLPAMMNVHWNFADETFDEQDSGIPRSLADRAKLPRGMTQVVRLALSICYSNRYDITSTHNVQRMADTGLQRAYEAVVADTPNTATYGSAPSRLMVSTLVVGGADIGYTRALYGNLARRRFNDLPPIANVFASQAEASGRGWAVTDKDGLMARVKKVFDPKHRSDTRLYLTARERQDAEDYIKSVLKPRYDQRLAEESRP